MDNSAIFPSSSFGTERWQNSRPVSRVVLAISAWTPLSLSVALLTGGFLAGCGSGGYPGGGISKLSASSIALDAGQSVSITATENGDSALEWSVSGPSCTGSQCGTVSTTSATSATYTTPSGVTAPMSVNLIAAIPHTASQETVSIAVNPDPALSNTLPAGVVGTSYSATVTATGGTLPRTMSMASGSLPSGLSFDATTGSVTGTPTVAGSFSFTVQLTDSSAVPYVVNTVETITIGASSEERLSLVGTVHSTGEAGVPYTSSLTATGGVTPYAWSIPTGSLPPGLTASPSTGVISGTPTMPGTFSFTAEVMDNLGATATAPESITINAQIMLAGGPLPLGVIGNAYATALSVAGGVTPYAWNIIGGALPPGISLSATTGAIAGTPTTAGVSTFTVQVKDSLGAIATAAESITVDAGLALTTVLPTGTVGTAYNAAITAAGGASPYTCSITGALPAGLTLTGCTVSGTPTSVGNATFTVKVTDSSSPTPQTASASETIVVAPSALAIANVLPNGTAGASYSSTITATGGTLPYTCSITGALPSGLSLSGCTVSGTPAAAGNATFTVKVTDSSSPTPQTASASETIVVAPSALTIANVLPNGTAGASYSSTITATGGTLPYTCSITGTLPSGLSLSGCTVSGTPTAVGNSTVTVKITDSSSPTQSVSGNETIVISAPALVLTGILPNGTVGATYSATIGATSGTQPYTCSITGTLPAGLSLSGCVVGGIPSASGSSTVTVRVTDSSNPAQTVSANETIVVAPSALTIVNVLPNGIAGVGYSSTITATGGTLPYTCSITGTLPAGLALTGCTVSGTPTTTDSSTVTVKVTDSGSPAQNASANETITINAAQLTLASTLPNGTVGVSYSGAISASGGTAPYTCSITGTLPAGLTLTDCTVSGTPTTAGNSTVTVRVTDSGSPAQTVNANNTISIAPTTLTLIGTLPNGTLGVGYNASILASGGTLPHSCSITGSLPGGLSLSGCTVSGTPTTAGSFAVTVKVTDGGTPAQNASALETIVIAPATLTLTGTLPNGTVGVPFSATIGANGGVTPYICAITGSLPAGLSLSGCTVSGTPTASGSSSVTVGVTDSSLPTPQNVSALETIVIAPATLTLTSTLPGGTVGGAYSAAITASNGTPPYTCSITGTLPAGLTLTGCLVSGTPTAVGSSAVTVRVTDAATPAQTDSVAQTIVIAPAVLRLSGALPNGTVGTSYSALIGTTGGTTPYTCSITGTLPAGLSLTGCTVSGTPTSVANSTVTVNVTDAGTPAQSVSGNETIVINAVPLALSGTLPNGAVGASYSATIGATGGTTPYTCSITGTLPAGLSLTGCTVSGTPTVAGSSTVTVKVTDASTPTPQTASASETVVIGPAALALTGTLPNGAVGTSYNATIGASGGTTPYACSITGTLPSGLILNGCIVSGTPTTAGNSSLTVKVTDSGSPTQTASANETIVINSPPLILTTTTLPNGTVGVPYTAPIGINGGTSPYTCSITGTLPGGLVLSGCTVSGTPTTAGSATVTLHVSDSSSPGQTTSGPETIIISHAALALTGALPNGTVGVAYTGMITASGGTSPYSCSVTGPLPSGLTLSGCTVSGTPTAVGTSTFSVTVTDSDSPVETVSGSESITINPSGTLSLTATLPGATVGAAYSYSFQATGGTPPYSYAIAAGALPDGLTLASDGALSGTPTAAGASSFTVTVTDSASTPATASLPLVLLVKYAPGSNDAELTGPYAYLFQGYDDVVAGVLAYKTAAVGSFTADGTGGISSGELDANHQSSNPSGTTVESQNFLGTYQVNADNRGMITITTLNTDGTTDQTFTYAISLTVPVSPATISTQGSLTEFDDNELTGTKGSGTLLAQTPSAFTAGLNGSYAFGLEGDTPCLISCTVGLASGPVATVGQFTAGGPGNISTGEADTNTASLNYPHAPLTGSSQTADANGRLQLEMVNTGISDGLYPTDYAAYIVNANMVFVMSTDKHSSYTLLAGTARLQSSSLFNNASLNGALVGYENAQVNPGLLGSVLQSVLNYSSATLFRMSGNGTGTCNTSNVDSGGLTGLINNLTGVSNGQKSNLLTALLGSYGSTGSAACTAASNGRAELDYPGHSGAISLLLQLLGLSSGPPAPRIAYLVSPNTGYFLETGYAGLGQFEPQTGAPFSLATLNGTYVETTVPASSLASINTSGYFTANGAGAANYTLDENIGVGTLNVLQLGTTATTTYSLSNPNNNVTPATAGRYVLANGTIVIYAISPTRFALVDTNATATSPSISLLY